MEGSSYSGDQQGHTFQFLNSGSFVGRAKNLRDMLEEISEYKSLFVSDQRAFVRYFLSHRGEGLVLDKDGSLFFTLHGVCTDSVIGQGGSFSNGNSSGVAVVHGNAGGLGGKKYYQDIYTALRRVTSGDSSENGAGDDDDDKGDLGDDESARGGCKDGDRCQSVTIKPPLYALAVTSYKKGDPKQAEKYFLDYLQTEEGKDHADSMYNLGVLCGESSRYEEAEKYYKMCLSADERKVSCLVNLGLLLVERVKGGQQRVSEGLTYLETAAQLDTARSADLKKYIAAFGKRHQEGPS